MTDLTFLREFCRNDRQKMTQYVKIFLESMPGIIEDLDLHLETKDADALRKTVHAIKPQVTFMGLESLKEKIEMIEEAIDAPEPFENIASLTDRLKSMLEIAADELVETLISLS